MKRLLSITVALLAIAVGAWAQHFTIDPPLPGGQSTETVVYAKLVTGTTLSGNLANYEIAALVDGNVRAIVTGNTDSYAASEGATAADFNYFVFSIPGNFTGTADTDNGKPITFKMYNSTTGLEYDLTSQALTFDGARHGTQSALFELSVTEVTGITLSSYRIDMNWDEEVDLSNYPRLTPTNATVPNNLKYTYGINPSYTDKLAVTEDGILTSNEAAVAPDRSWYAIITLGSYSQGIDVTVHNHAKELTVNPGYETITVNLGDSTTLRQKLAAAFSVTPENTSDYSTLTSANSSIVAIGPEATGVVVYNPVGLGETTVTKKYQWTRPGQPDSYTYTTASKTVNVKVVQPVTAINLLHSIFDCNVGDDVTEFIKQCYEVAPTDATDKSVTYELDPTSNQDVVTIENNTIKAVGKGLAEIIVRSVSNPEVYATITARVGDYATSLAADRDSHTYTYIDSDIDITGDIFGIIDPTTGLWTQIGMITAQPFGKDMYQLEVTSSDPNVVQVYPDSRSGQWYAIVKKAGTSTLTFNLSYPDFMAGTPGEPVIKAAEPVTLRIDVTQGATSIELSQTSIDANVGDDLTAYIKSLITVLPDGASQDVTFELAPSEAEGVITIENNTILAVSAGTRDIVIRSASNPDVSATLTVTVHQWATAFDASSQTTRYYSYTNASFAITNDIFGTADTEGAVITTPTGATLYNMDVTSSNTSVVQVLKRMGAVRPNSITIQGPGEATLTFTLSYPNYITGGTNTATHVMNIIVSQGVAAFSFNTSSITMNVGETIDLKDYVTIQPEGASVADNDYLWTVQESDGQYMSVTGNTLQALAPNIDQKGSTLQLQLQGYESLGTADITVFIYQPATSITVNTPEITVNKNDWEALKSALESAITVNPTNHTDEIVWTSDNEEYIAQQEVATGEATLSEWVPIKGGQTTMTVKVGTTTYNADGTPSFEAHATQQITVNINVPIESIALVAGTAYVNAGDDLTDYLNSIITILPEDATNKSYHFVGNNRIVVADGRVTLPTAGLGQVWAVADDGSGVESNKKAFAAVNQAKDVTFAKDITVKYTGSDVDISEEVKANITFDPANASRVNATVTSSNPDVATVDMTITNTTTNTAVNLGVTATAKAVGETTVTMAITYIDYLAELMDAAGGQHRTTVERTFKIIVSEGLSGFEIASTLPNPMVVGQSYTLTLTPQPEDAEFDPNGFEAWINGGGGLEDFADIEHQDNGDGTYSITVTPNYPSIGNLVVNYTDGTTDLGSVVGDGIEINVGVPTTLTKGWQWKTLWGAIETDADFAAHLGDGTDNRYVDEVRSQSALMANDPVYGYYGELYDQGLQPGVAYKFNATTAVGIADAGIQQNGEILLKEKPQRLQKAWTWIGNPYVLSHAISAAIPTATDGDRIVSKENGFAEYSGGEWTGTLTTLVPWQSYLYYNNSGAEKSFLWTAETDIPAASRSNSGVRFNAPRKVSPQSAWQYDASPFRDNMSMVAVVNEQWAMDNEQWTIGAFVDGECRGEGLCIDGRMFITVHANQGEEISFRLRNELTGEQYDVDQTVRMQLMLGTLKAPYRLTSEGVATGVSNVQSTMNNVQESYDLGGRAVNATTTKGLTIQRGSDGKVRKVVK